MPVGRRARSLALVGLVVLLAACGERSTVTGTVNDNFGQPAEGVVVSVNGGRATAVTDAAGHFELTYRPGSYDTEIGGGAYAVGRYTLRVRPPPGGPPVEATIERLPPEPGVYLVGEAGYVRFSPCAFRPMTFGDPPQTAYLVTAGTPALAPAPSGYRLLHFLEHGTPAPGPGQMAKARVGTEFYLTRSEARQGGLIVAEEPHAAEVEPEFPHEGRWFDVSVNAGTYVYSGRVDGEGGRRVPDVGGACGLIAFGERTRVWNDPAVTADQLAAFVARARTCLPPLDPAARGQILTLAVALKEDGTLAAPAAYVVPPEARNGGPAQAAAIDAVVAAIAACQPYAMFPPDDYAAWRDLAVTFDLAALGN